MLRVLLALIIAMADILVSDLQQEVRVVLDQNHTSTTLTTLGDVDTLTLDELIKSKLVPAAELVENAAPLYMIDCVEGGDFVDETTGQPYRFPAKIHTSTQPSEGVDYDADTEHSGNYWINTSATPTDHTGEYELPEGFMRLVSFKMEEWIYPVTDFITVDNPLYARLKSRYPGIRSNNMRPIVALLHEQRTTMPFSEENPALAENPSEVGEGWSVDGVRVFEFDIPIGGCLHLEQMLYVPYPTISGTGSSAKLTYISNQLRKSIVYVCAALVAQSLGDDNVSAKLLETGKQLGQWQ